MTVGAALTFEDLLLPAAEFSDPAAPEYRLCLVLQGEAELSWQQDDRWVSARLRPGMFAPLTRPHAAAQLRLSAHQRHLMVTVDAASFSAVAAQCEREVSALDALCERPFRNPFLARLCAEAYAEAQRGDALGQYCQTALAPVLIGGLLRHGAQNVPSRPAAGRALSETALRGLRDACLANLEGSITVATLALWSQLTVGELSRRLRARTGETPHQFVLGVRLHRAADLLHHSPQSLAEVASRCGFFDQAHLTQAFTRRYGSTPARYRRERQGSPRLLS